MKVRAWWTAGIIAVAAASAFAFYSARPRVPPEPRSASAPAAASSTGQANDVPSSIVFLPTIASTAPAPGPAPIGMVWIPGGEFSMGATIESEGLCEMHGVTHDSLPVHRVFVDGFWMDATELTNAAFAKFVAATGYVTIAERAPTAAELPEVPKENLVAGSTVFTPTDEAVPLHDYTLWWRYQKGANWRHPAGPESTTVGKERYPVVQLAYADADAYAKWARKRLPTEAEWEFAARGGLTGKLYPWGDDLPRGSEAKANTYQGKFPMKDTGEDGFSGLAPVAKFAPNAYGLYDMAGNVWEWTSDWYRPDYYATLGAGGLARNPQGPKTSHDPDDPGAPKRVQRGGSFLCTNQYCTRYMVGTRGKGEVSTASNHLGVRLVMEPGGKH